MVNRSFLSVLSAGLKQRWAMGPLAFFLTLTVLAAPRPSAAKGHLQIYFIDVEGGQSTLFVTPTGQSLLIDTGWADHNGRDADRIVAAAKNAGLSKIDYVLITHFHADHVGGVPQLVERIPVGTFIDHGPLREMIPANEKNWQAYQDVLKTGKYKHMVAHPGDLLPISGMKVTFVSGDGNLIDHSLPGGGQPNEYCKVSETRPEDQTENARSLGVLINFGKLKIVDLGDLTWDKEMKLMCPTNKLGHVDILVVSHHGWFHSSSPALVDAIHPRVAIMDNGDTKGGSTVVLDTIAKAPGLETLWQLHFSEEGGIAHNTKAAYIANIQGPDTGNYIELTASPNGSFGIFNERTKQTKDYAAR